MRNNNYGVCDVVTYFSRLIPLSIYCYLLFIGTDLSVNSG